MEVEAWTTDTTPTPTATVTLIAPTDGTNYPTDPASIDLTANVVAVNGWVTNRVDYYNGAILIGTSSTGPTYSFTWTPVPAGTYTLTAQAVESLGATSTSAAATVTVGALPVNVALQANGGIATSSSDYSANYPAAAVNNGDRTGANWGSGGGWQDATSGVYPDWVQITFNGPQTINKIDVFTIQDSFSSPIAPTLGMTFASYGITAFDVQYWNGSAWVTVTGGSIVGNNHVWNEITFPAVTTDRIRVLVSAALASLSRIMEVEAWTP